MTTVLTRPVLPERRERVVPVTIERASDVGGVLRVSGYAATFGHLSENLGGFVERLEPGCFGRALARPDCDLLLLHGHDRSRPSPGSPPAVCVSVRTLEAFTSTRSSSTRPRRATFTSL